MRRLRAPTVAAILALGAYAEWAALRAAPLAAGATAAEIRVAGADFVCGAVLTVAGATAVGRVPGDRIGRLLLMAGLAWYLGTFSTSGVEAYAEIGAVFVALHRGLLVHVFLTYPSGRADRLTAPIIVAAYVVSAVAPLAGTPAAVLVVAAATAGMAAVRARSSRGPERRARGVAAVAAALFSAALVVAAVVDLRDAGAFAARFALWTYDVAVAVAAAALCFDLLRRGWVRATVADLVLEAGRDARIVSPLDRDPHRIKAAIDGVKVRDVEGDLDGTRLGEVGQRCRKAVGKRARMQAAREPAELFARPRQFDPRIVEHRRGGRRLHIKRVEQLRGCGERPLRPLPNGGGQPPSLRVSGLQDSALRRA